MNCAARTKRLGESGDEDMEEVNEKIWTGLLGCDTGESESALGGQQHCQITDALCLDSLLHFVQKQIRLSCVHTPPKY